MYVTTAAAPLPALVIVIHGGESDCASWSEMTSRS